MFPTVKNLIVSLVILTSGAAFADPITWQVSADGRTVHVAGLDVPTHAELRVAGESRGVKLNTGVANGDGFALGLTWPLLPATEYDLVLGEAENARILSIALPDLAVGPALVQRVSPAGQILPANTLRIYVLFESPMARGNASRYVRLLDADGRLVPDAFLNIGVELWSADQTRLTMLLDPGRIKRGVGPNKALGLALEPGQSYAIEVAAGMPDAQNRPLIDSHRHWFAVGASEREQITPSKWSANVGDTELQLTFDRPMDEVSVLRNISLLDADNHRIVASAHMVDRTLTFTLPQGSGRTPHKLFVAAGLEDVAGNTLCAAFDVEAGVGRTCRKGVALDLLDLK